MSNRDGRRDFLKQSTFAAAGALGAGLLSRVDAAAAPNPVRASGSSHIKLSCAAYSYRQYLTSKPEPKMTLDDFVDACAAMNLDACEPTSYYFPDEKHVSDDYAVHLKHKTFLLGLDVSGTAVGNNFCLPPGEKRDAEIQHVKNWIDYSAAFGAPCIRIFAGSVPKGHTVEEARAWAVEGIKASLAHAAERGVFLALENHGGITSTSDDLLAIVDQIDHPWFGVNLDTGNFQTADPYADLAKAAPHAVTVQIKTEVSRGGKNEPADLARVIDILRAVDYRGYVALEYEAAEDPLAAIPRYCDELRKLIS
jgi:sugar phosphate isomerase/epimerase